MLGEILAWEHADPKLLEKHFLTVASYNLQHPSQFTDGAISGLKRSFIEHLDSGKPVAEIRQENARAYQGSARVLKSEPERLVVPRVWSVTVADVYSSGRSQDAASRVQAWAEATRSQL